LKVSILFYIRVRTLLNCSY